MKRTTSVTFTTDRGTELLRISDDTATIIIASANADQLRQLASAAEAAADELEGLHRATPGAGVLKALEAAASRAKRRD